MVTATRVITKEATQQRIVGAAIQLFSRYGFHGTSVRDIAREAGLNEVTLFRYFRRKDDLCLAAIKSSAGRITLPKELRDRMANLDPPALTLSSIAGSLAELGEHHGDAIRLLSLAMLESRPFSDAVRQCLMPVVSTLSSYLSSCMEAGTVRISDPDRIAWTLVTAATWQFSYDFERESGQAKKNQIEAYTVIWLFGLLADAKSPRAGAGELSQ